MAIVDSLADNRAVHSLTSSAWLRTWIGGSDGESEGAWKWVDGTNISWVNTSGFDNSMVHVVNGVRVGEDCLEIHSELAVWNDNNCHAEFPFACMGQKRK